jgi:hypothetical protein
MRNARIKILASAMLIGLFAVWLVPSARAGTVTLTLSAVSGSPGGMVTLDGTITNDSTNTVYLNGEGFTLGSLSFSNGDITDFFLNTPFSLAPDTSSGLIALFTFDIASGTAGGVYTGNFLDIIGGAEPSDFTDVLASSEFSANVTATPEPSTLLLLCTGLLPAVFLRRKRFSTNA